MRSYGRSSSAAWGVWLTGAIVAVVLAGAAGLAVYGGRIQPQQHEVEQVLSNEMFPG